MLQRTYGLRPGQPNVVWVQLWHFKLFLKVTKNGIELPQWDIYAIEHKIKWQQDTARVFLISRHALMHVFP